VSRSLDHSIAVCIVCRNERDRLGPALDSVQWADEILLLDLDSTDGSGDFAEQRGVKVVRRPAVPIVESVRNEIAAHATSDWILVLDPDERITPGLAAALREAAATDSDAVILPRMNIDLGFAPESPVHRFEPQLRMYRRSRVSWPAFPNAWPDVAPGRIYRVPLRDDLVMVHDRSRNIPEILERVVRYAPAQAQAMYDSGQRFTAAAMVRTLADKAHKQFVHANPWREGIPGLLRAWTLFSFHVWLWAAFWQISSNARTPDDDAAVRALGQRARWVRRWLALVSLPKRLLAAFTRRGTR
jgi:glycosyltransferase involved in cell wall biosynthesis